MRLGIRMALSEAVHLCAEADGPEEAVAAAARERPDVCLLGRHLAGDELAVVRSIRQVSPWTAVVLLGGRGDSTDMLEAVKAGALGYLPGELDRAGLRRVVLAVAAGEAGIPRALVGELVHELRRGEQSLTRREAEVLNMLRRGDSTAVIARRLEIAPVTVRRHISELTRKLGAADRSELIRVR
jgi:DNA-binding NarL/FixJ family response regulator